MSATTSTTSNKASKAPLKTPTDSLHAALRSQDVSAAKKSIEEGADVNFKNSWGRSMLHMAARTGSYALVELLLKSGAAQSIDVHATQRKNWTPLHCAAEGGFTKIVELLLANGAEVDTRTNQRWTALHWAACNGHLGVIKLLVERGANPNALNRFLWTPLHLSPNAATAELLLALGANPALQDENGDTAGDVIEAEDVKLVLKKHAKLQQGLSADERSITSPTAEAVEETNNSSAAVVLTSEHDVASTLSSSVEEESSFTAASEESGTERALLENATADGNAEQTVTRVNNDVSALLKRLKDRTDYNEQALATAMSTLEENESLLETCLNEVRSAIHLVHNTLVKEREAQKELREFEQRIRGTSPKARSQQNKSAQVLLGQAHSQPLTTAARKTAKKAQHTRSKSLEIIAAEEEWARQERERLQEREARRQRPDE